MDRINEIIIDNFGIAVFIMVLVAAFMIFGVWWARGIYDKVKKMEHLPCDERGSQLNKAEAKLAKVDCLPCGKHEAKLDGHTQIITRLDTTIELLKSVLYTPKQNSAGEAFTQSQSPLTITDAGHEMMERTGLQAMFEERWSLISSFVTEKARSMNPYDIQEMLIEQCVVHPDKFLTAQQIDILKLDAYNTGNVLASYMKVLAVLARDRYFEENDINISEVDAYAPNAEQ